MSVEGSIINMEVKSL